MMELDEVRKNLCYYDERNPERYEGDDAEKGGPEEQCYCDNCFHRRHELAVQILQQAAVLEEADKIFQEMQARQIKTQADMALYGMSCHIPATLLYGESPVVALQREEQVLKQFVEDDPFREPLAFKITHCDMGEENLNKDSFVKDPKNKPHPFAEFMGECKKRGKR